MPTPTTNMALPKPIDSDNAEAALASSIPTAFDKLDVHRHTGGADGLQIGTTAIPANAALLTPTLTVPTITNPLITGTVAGAATYTGPLLNIPTIASPLITGTISGAPTITAPLLTSPTITSPLFGTNSDGDTKMTFTMGDNWSLLQHLVSGTIRLALRPTVANRYFQVENTDGSTAFAVKASTNLAGAQTIIATPPADPGSGALGNGSIIFWLDEVGNNVKIRVRYSDGTAKLGIITLA